MRRFDDTERRARLARRHHLAEQRDDVVRVADDLVGLHSTDPASVLLAARARVAGFAAADLEHALYEQRTLARVFGMRGTMFVLPVATVPVVQAACARALVAGGRRRTVQLLTQGTDIPEPARWLDRVAEETLAALRERGEATAAELTRDVPDLATKMILDEDKKWGGAIGVSTRVLFLLATQGRIVRGRPRGSWTSTQYRWAPAERWFDDDVDDLASEDAERRLSRRWLRRFGPATVEDLKWWTGWTLTRTRSALACIDVVDVDLGGQPGIALADDLEPVAEPDPWVALLPALDSTTMGWKGRDWYLGTHRERLFDRNGNAGPTVWADGRVVGGWAHRRDGEVAVRLLEDVGAGTAAAIEAEAEQVGAWLGDVRFVPRFRTPLERELTA